MTKFRGLFKGSLILTLTRLMGSACTFILFWAISQNSVDELGAFRTIFVFFIFSEFLPLLGMNQYLIREIAVNRPLIKKYLSHALVFAWLICLALMLGLLLTAQYGKYSKTVSTGLLLVAVGLPATACILCFQSLLIGLGLGLEFGVLQGAEALIRTIFGMMLIYSGVGVLMVIAAFILVRWLIIIPYWNFFKGKIKKDVWSLERDFFKNFLKQVPVFAGIMLLFLVMRFAAQTMIPWMKGDAVAGQFAVAYQFLDLSLLLPTAFAINLMPIFAQRATLSSDEPANSCRMAIKIVAMTILPITVLINTLAEPLIREIFGPAYLPAVPLLKLMIWAAMLYSLDQVLSTALIAAGGQKMDFWTLFTGSLATVSSLYPLISEHGAIGAAWGLLLGVVVLVSSRMVLARSYLKNLKILSQLWRPGVAGIFMFLVIQPFEIHWILKGVFGIISYLLIMAVLGGFKKAERSALLQLLKT